jgi:hypothetical protein
MLKQVIWVAAIFLFEISPVVSHAVDRTPPTFVIGGARLYVGMSKHDAVTALSSCCKLLPPAESEVEKQPAPEDTMLGHIISSKEESSSQFLGAIYFSGGKVVGVDRYLAPDVDTWNEHAVALIRAMKRSLPENDGTAHVSVRHERMSNAESDLIVLTFPDGRGIEFHIGTLDVPDKVTNKRDFVTIDEILRQPTSP